MSTSNNNERVFWRYCLVTIAVEIPPVFFLYQLDSFIETLNLNTDMFVCDKQHIFTYIYSCNSVCVIKSDLLAITCCLEVSSSHLSHVIVLIVIFFAFIYRQSVIIDFLVYFGYIKDIFGEDGNNDYNGLSVKLQVSRNFLLFCLFSFIEFWI